MLDIHTYHDMSDILSRVRSCSYLPGVYGVWLMRQSVVHRVYVGESDEPKAPGPPGHRVLHHHRVLYCAVHSEILP